MLFMGWSRMWSLYVRMQKLFKNYHPVSLLSEVIKALVKLLNNELVNQLNK